MLLEQGVLSKAVLVSLPHPDPSILGFTIRHLGEGRTTSRGRWSSSRPRTGSGRFIEHDAVVIMREGRVFEGVDQPEGAAGSAMAVQEPRESRWGLMLLVSRWSVWISSVIHQAQTKHIAGTCNKEARSTCRLHLFSSSWRPSIIPVVLEAI